jgi:hypothetical protein
MIILYIPDNPTGFVKPPEELELEVSKCFKVFESVHLSKTNLKFICKK